VLWLCRWWGFFAFGWLLPLIPALAPLSKGLYVDIDGFCYLEYSIGKPRALAPTSVLSAALAAIIITAVIMTLFATCYQTFIHHRRHH
jgi:hypothetical protein